MKNATKKQMVDFLHALGKHCGEKFPKRKLNQLSEEVLMDLICTQKESVEAFEKYLSLEKEATSKPVERKTVPQKPTQEEKEAMAKAGLEKLEALAERSIADPGNMFILWEYSDILRCLPRDIVTVEDLRPMLNRLTAADNHPNVEAALSHYMLNRILHPRKKKW